MTVYVNGVISNELTPEVDKAIVEGHKKDVINGSLTGTAADPRNTFNPNDQIIGNGKTILNLSVSNWNTSIQMPGVDVSGVRVLKLKNLDSQQINVAPPPFQNSIYLDATNWGHSLERIYTSGSKGMLLDVAHLTAGTKLILEASGDKQGITVLDAAYGDTCISGSVQNTKDDATNAKAVVNASDVIATAGLGDVVEIGREAHTTSLNLNRVKATSAADDDGSAAANVGDTLTSTNANKSAGDFTIAKLSAVGGDSDVTVQKTVDVTGIGNASVGQTLISDVVARGNEYADIEVKVESKATTDTGSATVGSIGIQSVELSAAAVTLTSADVGRDVVFSVTMDAEVDTAGAASVDKAGIGNISLTLGDGQEGAIAVLQEATTASGAASIDALGIGSIDVKAEGNAGAPGTTKDGILIDRNASSTAAGDATIGLTAVRSIDVTSENGDTAVAIDIDATAAALSKATVGEPKIGNVNAETLAGDFAFFVGIDTVGGGGALGNENHIDSLTIGNIDVTTAGGDALVGSLVSAANGSIENVTLGNVDVNVVGAGKAAADFGFTASKAIGNVTVGNMSVDAAGAGTSVSGFSLKASAASVGNVSVGDLSVVAAGAVTKTVGPNNILGVQVSAVPGSVGTVEIGHVELEAVAGGTFKDDFDVYVNAGTNIGASKIGSIDIDAVADSTVSMDVKFAAGGNLGGLTIGEIEMEALGSGSKSEFKVDLSAAGTKGDLTIGHLDLSADNLASATKSAEVVVDVKYAAGNINVGGIEASSLTPAVGTGAEKGSVDVNFLTGNGTVDLGDITVTGGNKIGGVTLGDNLDVLSSDVQSKSWLSAVATVGSVTVGDIDYSAYTGAATIDVFDWKGASDIKASTGGSTITGNVTQNDYHLGAGNDVVIFEGVQLNGLDTDTADHIFDFAAGGASVSGADMVKIDNSGSGVATVGVGSATTYAEFITNATTSIVTNGDDVYAQQMNGTDTYFVAVDSDANGTIDYVFKMQVASGTLDSTDFGFV